MSKVNFLKFIFFIFCFLFIFWALQRFFKEDLGNHLSTVGIFEDDEQMKGFCVKINNLLKEENTDTEKKEQGITELLSENKYLEFFYFSANNKGSVMIKDTPNSKKNATTHIIKISLEENKTCKINIDDMDNPIVFLKTDNDWVLSYNLCFNKEYFQNKKETEAKEAKNNVVKDFFTVAAGTNKEYLLDDSRNNFSPKISCLLMTKTSSANLPLKLFNGYSLAEITKIDMHVQKDNNYNETIKKVLNDNKDKQNNYFTFKLITAIPSQNNLSFKMYVNDTGYLPIQWHSKLDFSGGLGFYYIWNVLIILIGIFLSCFSSLFNNFGFGIIFTTILIRTLSWPIYTKTSTFSLNMNLAQPEIEKIQKKYILKKDLASTQKMQLETLKVYKKYNVSFLSFFISFLQMPIFISMLSTLNRFRIPGGIFNPNGSEFKYKDFLGFIDLSNDHSVEPYYKYILIKISLSVLVGITMLILNKINFRRQPNYLKSKSNSIINLEEQAQKEKKEKMFKIMNYFMVMIMMFTAFRDNVLSLYWIVGNTYTIFQILFNRKIMNKHKNILN